MGNLRHMDSTSPSPTKTPNSALDPKGCKQNKASKTINGLDRQMVWCSMRQIPMMGKLLWITQTSPGQACTMHNPWSWSRPIGTCNTLVFVILSKQQRFGLYSYTSSVLQSKGKGILASLLTPEPFGFSPDSPLFCFPQCFISLQDLEDQIPLSLRKEGQVNSLHRYPQAARQLPVPGCRVLRARRKIKSLA